MSMFAFCASRVSWISTGSARALISWSLPLPLGYWTTETSVSEPLATVSSTWTGPQRVEATEPVTVLDVADVPVPDDAVPDDAVAEVELEDESDDVVPDGVADVLPVTGAWAEDCPPAAASDDVDVW